MSNQFLDSLKYIKPEPVPESLWSSIQQSIAHKRMQVAPIWMRMVAALVVFILLVELLASFRTSNNNENTSSYTAVFNDNNQWYHD